ncbi:putative baseplate assembly protein [Melittangium boletus]|uniref:putative baseplate assembly protein n=1 Tax=Melittangium boletus TaxID=83453 RepID=UPI003DA64B4E
MPLPSPHLDDRDFQRLLEDARAHLARACPEWTDPSPHDPGQVLLELFAYLTDTLLYRLNRLPEKAYVEFLRLLGVRLQSPSAATARLRFTLPRPAERPVEIPRGTGVTTSRPPAGAEPIVFLTAEPVRIPPGAVEAEGLAHHGEQVEGEAVGVGTGQPGLSVTVRRPPIVAPTGDGRDLVVGVEARPEDLSGRVPARTWGGKTFRLWHEVESFTHLPPDEPAFMVDRMTGTLTFAPAARMLEPDGALSAEPRTLAASPGAGRAIVVWYLRGGGLAGNVAAGALDTLKVALPGVRVTNPAPAVGGRAAETLENALIRGPQELHSLGRAITAQDYERLALRGAGAARARAFTQAHLWAHAVPGTVEVLLVPTLPPQVRGPADEGVTQEALREHETDEALARVRAVLDERIALGTACQVSHARYKTVCVRARVVAHAAEDLAALERRSLARLHQALSPLPTPARPEGWPFGEALRASHVYDILLAEPGVSYVDQVRLRVDEVPREVRTLCEDAFQPGTFFAGGGDALLRTVSGADGWERVGRFPGEQVEVVETHPQRAGWVAVAARVADAPQHSRVHLSRDCGETWERATHTLDHVEDLAWTLRDGGPVLWLATRVGLFELTVGAEATTPLQVLVEPADHDLGFACVAAAPDARGGVSLAVAGLGMRGVYLSHTGGQGFRPIGLKDQDVRVLEVQHDGPRAFLWAGLAAASGEDAGKGCLRRELLGAADPPDGWLAQDKGWDGGSCLALAFEGNVAHAATHRAGVLWMDASRRDAAWSRPGVDSGLPLRERERLFQPVQALAAAPEGGLLLVGGQAGCWRRRGAPGGGYLPCSTEEFTEKVTLPPTWLLVSGAHALEVVTVDEAR